MHADAGPDVQGDEVGGGVHRLGPGARRPAAGEGLDLLTDPAEEQRAARAPRGVVVARARPRPTRSRARAGARVEAVDVERGGRAASSGSRPSVPRSAPGPRSVGELDRVEHRHELVVLPHRVVAHRSRPAAARRTRRRRPRPAAPTRTAARGARAARCRPRPPGAVRTAVSRCRSPSARRTSSPTPRSTAACTMCSGPCSGRRCRSKVSARHRHGDERARPRKQSGVGWTHAASGAPAPRTGPRGFEAGGPDAAGHNVRQTVANLRQSDAVDTDRGQLA